MKDYLTIGPVPYDEPCEQVPYKDPYKARLECLVFIRQLRRELGEEPHMAQLAIKAFPHEAGTYHEVVCWYNSKDKASVDYAFKCESEAPANWDEEAKRELANYSSPEKKGEESESY